MGTKRVSMARLICTKSGRRSRLIYRIHLDRGPAKGRRKGRRKGFTEKDYASLLDAVHQQFGMWQLIDAQLWLTVYQLPPYAPEFNPVEGVWLHLKRSLAGLTRHTAPTSSPHR